MDKKLSGSQVLKAGSTIKKKAPGKSGAVKKTSRLPPVAIWMSDQ